MARTAERKWRGTKQRRYREVLVVIDTAIRAIVHGRAARRRAHMVTRPTSAFDGTQINETDRERSRAVDATTATLNQRYGGLLVAAALDLFSLPAMHAAWFRLGSGAAHGRVEPLT